MSEKLENIRKLARKLGIEGKITNSKRKGKKYVIATKYGNIHFGAKDMEDWWDHRDKKRRANYLKRAKGILKDGVPSWKNPKSANFYSVNLLWPEKI